MIYNACMLWKYQVNCPSIEHVPESIESLLDHQSSSRHTGHIQVYENIHMIMSEKRNQIPNFNQSIIEKTITMFLRVT